MNRYFSIFLLGLLAAGCARFEPRPLAPAVTAAGLESRSLDNPSLRAFLEANLHRPLPEGPAPPWDLERLTLTAFYYHPDLDVARAQWAVARAGQITAGERPNPSVGVSAEYNMTTPPPWIPGLNVDIPVETAGKRGHRLEQARQLSDAARWSLVATVWQVRSRVRASLLDLYAARESETLLARQETAQAEVVRLLEGQLTAGNIASFEVTQARIALDTARLARQEARRQSAEALAKLADALGLPARALADAPLSFTGLDAFPTQLTAPEVRHQAVLNRADVRGALADYAASQAALQLEIARQYPDVHLGPGYLLDQTDSKWSLGLTVTLPILNQNQGAIAEAKARREEMAARFLAVQAKALGDIDRALAGYAAAVQKSATAAALLTNLQQRLDSVRALLRAGETDPLAVANAQAEFNTGALARIDALVKAQQALGQLEDAVQSPLVLPDAVLQATQENPRTPQPISQHEP